MSDSPLSRRARRNADPHPAAEDAAATGSDTTSSTSDTRDGATFVSSRKATSARSSREDATSAVSGDATSARSSRDDGATAATASGDEKRERKPRSTARTWLDRLILVVAVWAIWAFITTFVVQPFRIPSGSMENTLRVGDRIVVAKWAPRFTDVKRGDVIVFKDPGDWTDPVPSGNAITGGIRKIAEVTHLSASGSHLVKRVVGVGGDKVSCEGPGQKLTVNGVAITEPYLKSGVQPCQDKFSITVPKDKVWVMGDNRSNSADSRYHDDGTGRLGSVPVGDITGRGLAVVWPIGNIAGGHNDEDAFSKVPAAR